MKWARQRMTRWWNSPETGNPAEEESLPLGRVDRFGPWLLVALPVVYALIMLRAELATAAPPNDSAVHHLWVEWAADQFRAGRIPVDGWVSNLGFGVSQFHFYQSTPHVLSGAIEAITGWSRVVNFTIYFGVSLWPISVFCSLKRLRIGRWGAAVAASVSLFMLSQDGHGLEILSYVWRGRGVWSQLWAMWVFPWALVLTWRSTQSGKNFGRAVAAVSLTACLHLIQAYMLFLVMPFWALIDPVSLKAVWTRVRRVAILGGVGFAGALWAILPFLLDAKWAGNSEFNVGTFYVNSYGFKQVMAWLVSGEVLDAGRFPVLTLLGGAGLVTALIKARRSEAHRVPLVVLGVALCLWFGRETWGDLVNLLPGGEGMIFHRFVLGVQLAGLMLIATGTEGIAAGFRMVTKRLSKTQTQLPTSAVAVGASFAALAIAVGPMNAFLNLNTQWIREQSAEDNVMNTQTTGNWVAQLVTTAKDRGPGRYYAGLMSSWGAQAAVKQTPFYNWIPATMDVDIVGFNLRTFSLTGDSEPRFDDTNAAQFNLFNVRYVIANPSEHPPTVPAQKIKTVGQVALWEIETTGYLDAIDIGPTPISATRVTLARQSIPFLTGQDLQRKIFPAVDMGYGNPLPPSSAYQLPLDARISDELVDEDRGTYGASVSVNRDAYVLLKMTYHPRWKATVDGQQVETYMVAPGFVAVPISEGTHTVRFAYQSVSSYRVLVPLSALALTSTGITSTMWHGRRRRQSPSIDRTEQPVTS